MNFKKYLPVENYTLASRLSVEEVLKRLADNIEPKKRFRSSAFSTAAKPFEGQISGNTFTISRVINYRNSFLPVINGHISSSAGRTEIKVKMRPFVFVLVFISIWLGTVGLACLSIILVALFQFRQIMQHGFSPVILIPFVMFIFGSLLTTLAFKSESKKAKDFLATVFEGSEQPG